MSYTRGSWRTRLVACLGLLLLFNAPPATANVSICEAMLESVSFRFVQWRHGNDIANFYARIVQAPHFHTEKRIRKLGFRLMAGVDLHPEVTTFLASLTPEKLAFYLEALEPLTRPEQVYLLTNIHPFWQWRMALEARTKEPEDPYVPYVNINNLRIPQALYQDAIKLQQTLATEGIVTSLTAGLHHEGGYRPFLNIEKITRPLVEGMNPNKSIFDSQDFFYFLELARKKKGTILIDPDLLTSKGRNEAYFWNQANAINEINWFIAVKPKSSWSVLIHEWTHQQDFASEKQNYYLSLLATQKPHHRSNWFAKAIRSTGERLESEHLTELNAIKMQFLFYKMTGITSDRVTADLRYRSQNQLLVGLGRILMDPTNFDHYGLIFKSIGSRLLAWGLLNARYQDQFE